MELLNVEAWFQGQHWLLLAALIAVSMVILMKGADVLVDGASRFAIRAGLPKVIVGATIVSLGTTTPEAAVSVMGAIQGNAGLALGNAVGSVIADTGLIFGIGCLMTVLPADRYVLNRQGWLQFGSGVLLATVCYGLFMLHGDEARIGRPVGLFFLALLGAYLFVSVRWARGHGGDAAAGSVASGADAASPESIGRLLGLFVVGLVLVLLSCRVLILSASELALQMRVPEVVVASTIIAFGTSLPELVVSITSVLKKQGELLVGNVIGADILNVLFVIGAAATATPLPIIYTDTSFPRIFLYVHLPSMLVILVLFRVFIAAAGRRGHFERWFGLAMVVLWVGYVVFNYVASR